MRTMSREEDNAEKRRRAAVVIAASNSKSSRQMAREAGVSQATIVRVRQELISNGSVRTEAFSHPLKGPRGPMGPRNPDKDKAIRDFLLEDPRRSNRLIAKEVKVAPDTVRLVRDKMEKAKEIPAIARQARLNINGKVGHGGGPGSKIEIPDGQTLMQVAARGLKIEEDNEGSTLEDAALLLGINVKTYRYIRVAYLLSLRHDLSSVDVITIRNAIAKMEEAKQVTPFWPPLEPIASKIWGSGVGMGVRGAKAEERRRKSFDHAVGLIFDTCSRGPEVEIPYLAEAEQIEVLRKLTEAIGGLKTLASNIRRARG